MRILKIMTKINQKLFSNNYCEELLSNLNEDSVDSYLEDEPFVRKKELSKGKSKIMINKSFALKIPKSKNEHFDLENAIIIHKELENLSPLQASDRRLWTYLTHVTFWDYMRKRWPLERFLDDTDLDEETDTEDEDNKANGSTDRKIRFIQWRYHLVTTSRRRLLRNGIARLWWYVYMTKDEGNSDPYHLTRTMLKFQDVAQNLLERSLGSDKTILKAFLNFLEKNQSLSKAEIRTLIKEINLISGVQNLHLLGQTQLTKNIDIISQRVLS